jgi:hypothetical protein
VSDGLPLTEYGSIFSSINRAFFNIYGNIWKYMEIYGKNGKKYGKY